MLQTSIIQVAAVEPNDREGKNKLKEAEDEVDEKVEKASVGVCCTISKCHFRICLDQCSVATVDSIETMSRTEQSGE